MTVANGFILRKALVKDVDALYGLLLEGTRLGVILPRSKAQIFTALRDFYVLEDPESGDIAGCCALALIADGLAEVRSLYVSEKHRRKGLGQILVAACVDDAVALGFARVFTLTYQTDFFATLGFSDIPKESLPQKIWTDCIQCPKFPNCDENAMIRSL